MPAKNSSKKDSPRGRDKKNVAPKRQRARMARGKAAEPSNIGFRTFAMHANDPAHTPTFNALRSARPSFRGFAMAKSVGISNLDPETVAYQYLQQALVSDAVPSFTAPQAEGVGSEFKSLGTETLPLTNTKTVKFRQAYNKIPVYSSLVTVELDEHNDCLAINSALGVPSGVSPVAKVSPAEAVKKTVKLAGRQPGRELTPRLNYYFDRKANRWRLVYIMEDVPVKRLEKTEGQPKGVPFLMDYFIDAHTGALVAELPRTATMAGPSEEDALDGLAKQRRIRYVEQQGRKILQDDQLNVLTYDFNYQDPDVEEDSLPGRPVINPPVPWAPEAVSAHANAVAVADFLRNVLKRNSIDNKGGAIISTVNCVVARNNRLGKKQWLNAFWTPRKRQMVYGQVLHGQELRSLAVNVDVVGHEMFHGVTNDTSRLEYAAQSGALNESYSDIFGMLISNFDEPDIAKWDWQLGEKLTANEKPLRDLSRPSHHNQPEHMDEYQDLPLTEDGDYGGVHTNSGIHNFAAYKIMTARDTQQRFIFTPRELAAMFYIALTQHLTRSSDFSASRRGITLATQTLFRNDPQAMRQAKIAVITKAFTDVGITEPAE